jgi:hypothetical protein
LVFWNVSGLSGKVTAYACDLNRFIPDLVLKQNSSKNEFEYLELEYRVL